MTHGIIILHTWCLNVNACGSYLLHIAVYSIHVWSICNASNDSRNIENVYGLSLQNIVVVLGPVIVTI